MGALLTVLVSATMLAAPEAEVRAPAPATPLETAPAPAPGAVPAGERSLRPVEFEADPNPTQRRADATTTGRPAYDLRNPFRQPRPTLAPVAPAPAPAPKPKQARRATRAKNDRDLRDPFAQPPVHRVLPKAKPDLRDPFAPKAKPAPRKCPDTGGVPIQRPESLKSQCVQASRRAVLARR